MRNILFVCGRYYPKASPNSICIQNIIDELPPSEYNVHILCYKDGLEDKSKVETTKVSRGWIQSSLYKLEGKTGKINEFLFGLFQFFQKLKQLLLWCVYPWTDPIVTLREIQAAEKLYQSKRYDTIIAVYMPLSSLIVGYIMKKRHPEIHYIAYFLDSLSGGAAPRFLGKKTYNKKAIWWEKKVLSNADKTVFMEASKTFHKEVYEGSEIEKRIVYLDLPMLKQPKKISGENEGGVVFVYVGSLAPSVRSPAFFLKVFSKAAELNWKLFFVGDATCELLNEYAKRDNRIKVIGRCSHEEALLYESKATILLNLGNRNANLTPSKIFEYMSFEKKIVSTYPIDNEASKAYLERYPNALLLDERGDVDEATLILQSFVKQGTQQNDYNELKRIFKCNTPGAFIDVINSLG